MCSVSTNPPKLLKLSPPSSQKNCVVCLCPSSPSSLDKSTGKFVDLKNSAEGLKVAELFEHITGRPLNDENSLLRYVCSKCVNLTAKMHTDDVRDNSRVRPLNDISNNNEISEKTRKSRNKVDPAFNDASSIIKFNNRSNDYLTAGCCRCRQFDESTITAVLPDSDKNIEKKITSNRNKIRNNLPSANSDDKLSSFFQAEENTVQWIRSLQLGLTEDYDENWSFAEENSDGAANTLTDSMSSSLSNDITNDSTNNSNGSNLDCTMREFNVKLTEKTDLKIPAVQKTEALSLSVDDDKQLSLSRADLIISTADALGLFDDYENDASNTINEEIKFPAELVDDGALGSFFSFDYSNLNERTDVAITYSFNNSKSTTLDEFVLNANINENRSNQENIIDEDMESFFAELLPELNRNNDTEYVNNSDNIAGSSPLKTDDDSNKNDSNKNIIVSNRIISEDRSKMELINQQIESFLIESSRCITENKHEDRTETKVVDKSSNSDDAQLLSELSEYLTLKTNDNCNEYKIIDPSAIIDDDYEIIEVYPDNVDEYDCQFAVVENDDTRTSEIFCCSLCERICRTYEDLVGHSIVGHCLDARSGVYQCAICSTVVRDLDEFVDHVNVHNEHSKFKVRFIFDCALCDSSDVRSDQFFTNTIDFYRHLKEHDELFRGISNNGCRLCDYVVPNRRTFFKHTIDTHYKDNCPFCGLVHSTRTAKTISEHLTDEHNETDRPVVNCPVCRVDLSVYDLTHHLINEHSARRDVKRVPNFYRCGICSNVSDTLNKLSKHLCRKLSSDVCRICKTRFTSKKRLAFHTYARHKHGRPFECDVCWRVFDDDALWYDHVRFGHEKIIPSKCSTSSGYNKKPNSKPYVCAICDAVFVSRVNLKDHTSVKHAHNKKPYKCHVCALRYGRVTRLNQHLQMHYNRPDNDKRQTCFICSECGFASPMIDCNDRFSRHRCSVSCDDERNDDRKRIGELSKVLLCEYCQATYSDVGLLYRHVSSVHIANCDDVDHRYVCNVCLRRFSTFARLTTHRLRHGYNLKSFRQSDEIPRVFGCCICEKTFARYTNFVAHRKCCNFKRKKVDKNENNLLTDVQVDKNDKADNDNKVDASNDTNKDGKDDDDDNDKDANDKDDNNKADNDDDGNDKDMDNASNDTDGNADNDKDGKDKADNDKDGNDKADNDEEGNNGNNKVNQKNEYDTDEDDNKYKPDNDDENKENILVIVMPMSTKKSTSRSAKNDDDDDDNNSNKRNDNSHGYRCNWKFENRNVHICNYCHKPYLKQVSYLNHLSTSHGLRIKLRCYYCKIDYLYLNDLDKHVVNEHTPPKNTYRCDQCFRTFATNNLAKKHVFQRHVRQMRLKNNNSSNNDDNNNENNNETIYQCKRCKYMTDSLRQILRHNKKMHVKYQLECTSCGAYFSSSYKHTKHRRTCLMNEI